MIEYYGEHPPCEWNPIANEFLGFLARRPIRRQNEAIEWHDRQLLSEGNAIPTLLRHAHRCKRGRVFHFWPIASVYNEEIIIKKTSFRLGYTRGQWPMIRAYIAGL